MQRSAETGVGAAVLLDPEHPSPLLSDLLNPVDVAEFFAEHYEKKPLVVRGNAESRFDDILTVADLDDLLRLEQIPPQSIATLNNSDSVPMSAVFKEEDGVRRIELDADKLLKQVHKGNSVILNRLQKYQPKLRRFTNRLGHETTCQIAANVYVSPPAGQALAPHYDRHDVFILQIDGSKHWKLYDSPVPLPEKRHLAEFDDATLAEEFELHRGDLLYMPRGFWHQAGTTDSTSVHVTVGLYPLQTKHLVNVLQQDLAENVFFRKSLHTVKAEAGGSDELERLFKDAIAKQLASISIDDLIERATDNYITHKLPKPFGGGLTEFIRKSDALDDDSMLCCHADESYEIDASGDFCTVEFRGGKTTYPVPYKEIIERIVAVGSLRVGDISDTLSSDMKKKIASAFLGDGLVYTN